MSRTPLVRLKQSQQWKTRRKRHASCGIALRVECAAMSGDNSPANRETEPHPLTLCRVERLENVAQGIIRQTVSVIDNLDDSCQIALRCLQANSPVAHLTILNSVERIHQQVERHLLNLDPIAAHRLQA